MLSFVVTIKELTVSFFLLLPHLSSPLARVPMCAKQKIESGFGETRHVHRRPLLLRERTEWALYERKRQVPPLSRLFSFTTRAALASPLHGPCPSRTHSSKPAWRKQAPVTSRQTLRVNQACTASSRGATVLPYEHTSTRRSSVTHV